jgi:hypothetical protein
MHRIDLGVDVTRGLGDKREKIFEHGTPWKPGSRGREQGESATLLLDPFIFSKTA